MFSLFQDIFLKNFLIEQAQLFPIDVHHPKFTDIERQFSASWRHLTKKKPKIHHLYYINNNSNLTNRYKEYQKEVIAAQPVTLPFAGPYVFFPCFLLISLQG